MTRLSVNINKIATLRNARGGGVPDVVEVARYCEKSGAHGITVHPRPDERHITGKDVLELKGSLSTEFNIEGYPDKRLMDLLQQALPTQATLVPDPPKALTSDKGWDLASNLKLLRGVVYKIQSMGIRVSLFVFPRVDELDLARETGTDRVELFTKSYATGYRQDREGALSPYLAAAERARELGLGINAGHDLNLSNIGYLAMRIPHLDEVSIGHALVCESLMDGLGPTIKKYLRLLKAPEGDAE